MTTEEINKLHEVHLKLMDKVHSFCVENKLRYYLIAGSALGAVRHGGIIPWDVDMDIAMPRSDYQKFLELNNKIDNPYYDVYYYENKRNLNSPHALIVLKNSKVEYNGGFETYGIYIDLFPLDTCPDDTKLRKKQMHRIQRINRILQHKKPWKGRIVLFTIYHKLVSWVLKPISIDKINGLRDKVMREYEANENTAECWCSMASGYKYTKQCMPQAIYGTPVLMDFEGRQYYVPEHVEDHLKHLYGDFMKLPPIEAREALINSIKYAEWTDDHGQLYSIGK